MEVFLLLSTVLGGLAVFLLGMSLMTEGLARAAGFRLRMVISRVTHRKSAGVGLGTLLGLLVHSSAATVMLVAFVNAGLMSLAGSIPPMIGANIGTTLSMQLISLNLGAYCFVVIAVGFFIKIVWPVAAGKDVGSALLGFGLIFLGMNIMSDAIQPHREVLEPLLEGSTAATVRGMAFGIAIAALVTAIIQSSGATIGMCFALASAGVFDDLANVFPIVLGAHIGTCATALLGSIGTNIEARRCALAHLLFNLFGVIVAVVLSKPLLLAISATSPDLIRQTANLHTAVMVLTAAIMLPGTGLFVRALRAVTPSKRPLPEQSYLDYDLTDRPEAAIYASIRELQRLARIACESFRLLPELMLFQGHFRKRMQRIRANEMLIDEIKPAMHAYLSLLTHAYLSRRQAILIQHVNRCVVEIERIGDHVEALAILSVNRRDVRDAIFGEESFKRLFGLYESAAEVLRLVTRSLDPNLEDQRQHGEVILRARDEYRVLSAEAKEKFTEKMDEKTETPMAGIYYSEYISGFDRIVKHAKTIALAEQHPRFWIKRKKLERKAGAGKVPVSHPLVDPEDILDRLRLEGDL